MTAHDMLAFHRSRLTAQDRKSVTLETHRVDRVHESSLVFVLLLWTLSVVALPPGWQNVIGSMPNAVLLEAKRHLDIYVLRGVIPFGGSVGNPVKKLL